MHESDPSNLPTVPYARLDRLLRVGERLWQERPDVRHAHGSIRSWEFWYWLMWHGPREYGDVRAALYATPPQNLMNRIVGEVREEVYRHSGLVNWRGVLLYLLQAGADLAQPGTRILDFGCGSGRILQFFGWFADACTVYGTDVDAQAVSWCREAFDFAEFSTLPKKPPSGFESGTFDAIYAYSVFSHLPEKIHRAWLEELHRIAKPGAAIVLTTMGRHCLHELANGRTPGAFPSADVVSADLAKCERDGFRFYPYKRFDRRQRKHEIFDAIDVKRYGSTFILPSYVRKKWLDLFDLVAIHEAPDAWQDYVVLKRRG